ncbi:D-alanyl-D-alanine carboxypeptidase family protein [Nocardia cyriacigeorgica]|uniref:D-alanyl-D-alanine carboxypeptidase dacD n=1 Tax=Nocardia cyriacigeorgica TaxID=135487 RepID=A0A4U8W617_9NOCA|nr:D-alanyl-D-alanine carboxypeptidase family protein [Nocardia cyriacigeorgica]VFB01502.1 D-alanyl-D-alanine carboxypeptidase dacD precursor [Nocardia cyriacigeorgica]
MNMRELRRRAVVAVAAVLTVGAVASGGPAMAEPTGTTAPTTTPFTTPNTDNCAQRTQPPPPIDLSEVPEPGQPTPKPLPVPDPPIGGERMGECGVVVPDGAPAVPAEISATAWMVSDMDTGEVLAAKDPHGRYRPASTIKVLLATVALRTLDLDTVVTGTQADADVDGTRVGIGPGGRYTNRQLMQALIMASGNDAAHAIAAQLGGDDAAVAKMNELAKSLHALDTRAATPSGLDGPGMSTSAYDLSLLFREAMTIPLFAELIHTEQIDFPGYPADPRIPGDQDHPGFPVGNDNHLLYNYEGALGGKTGFTDDARQTFVAAAERDGRRLIVTLLKADVLPIRPWEQAARLLDYGFALDPGESVGSLPGADTESAPTGVALAAPPQGSEVGHLAQPQGSPDRDDLRWVLVVGGAIMVLVLLGGARRIARRR